MKALHFRYQPVDTPAPTAVAQDHRSACRPGRRRQPRASRSRRPALHNAAASTTSLLTRCRLNSGSAAAASSTPRRAWRSAVSPWPPAIASSAPTHCQPDRQPRRRRRRVLEGLGGTVEQSRARRPAGRRPARRPPVRRARRRSPRRAVRRQAHGRPSRGRSDGRPAGAGRTPRCSKLTTPAARTAAAGAARRGRRGRCCSGPDRPPPPPAATARRASSRRATASGPGRRRRRQRLTWCEVI